MVSPEGLQKQLQSVCDDIHLDAVKIGMTGSASAIHAIHDAIVHYHLRNVVLDPVMVASSGDRLTKSDVCALLKESLIPLCSLVTPNLPEVELGIRAYDQTSLLLGRQVEPTVEAMKVAAKELCQLGCGAVLVKGGHVYVRVKSEG